MNTPTQIGQYRILQKIGAGGMGMVFLGEHLLIGRRAAIKTLQPALSKQPEIVERFFNEARATSAIPDGGIVQVFDFGYHVDGTAYIVMELLEGEGLANRLDRLGTLPIPTALRIARQIASSLAAAHAQDIVHRDLKPENIFLIRDREAQGGERTKLLDFGICAVGCGAPDAPAEVMIGTPVYMAPEQCTGAARPDPRSDIYGLGCVLYQMLSGNAPFERDSVRELIRAHIGEVPPAPSTLREEIPPVVDALVLRCLAKSPDDRFPSMIALGTAIEEVLAELAAPEPPSMSITPAPLLGEGFRSRFIPAVRPGFDFDFDDAPRRSPPPPALQRAPVPARAWTPPQAVAAGGAAMGTVSPTLAQLRKGPLRRAALAIGLLASAVLMSLVARLDGGEGLGAEPKAAAAAAAAPRGAGHPMVTPIAQPPAAVPPSAAPEALAVLAAPERVAVSESRTGAAQRRHAAATAPAPAADPAPSSPPSSAPSSAPSALSSPAPHRSGAAPAAPAVTPAAPSRALPQPSAEDLYESR